MQVTGISIKIQGHLKINEYKNRRDYQEGRISKQLLNKRNAVHKDDAAIMIGKVLTDRTNGPIAYMVFGNGGTAIDGSGNIVFKTPNTSGTDANLYNPVLFQLVDDTIGALPGNQMAVRHITNTLFSDIDIRCLIDINQPFGQLSSNILPGNLTDWKTQFSFDEIGLKLADGTLATHVIFSPVLKTASSLLEIVYTLRIAVAQPLAPALFNLTGVQANTEVGLFGTPISTILTGMDATSAVGTLTPPPPIVVSTLINPHLTHGNGTTTQSLSATVSPGPGLPAGGLIVVAVLVNCGLNPNYNTVVLFDGIDSKGNSYSPIYDYVNASYAYPQVVNLEMWVAGFLYSYNIAALAAGDTVTVNYSIANEEIITEGSWIGMGAMYAENTASATDPHDITVDTAFGTFLSPSSLSLTAAAAPYVPNSLIVALGAGFTPDTGGGITTPGSPWIDFIPDGYIGGSYVPNLVASYMVSSSLPTYTIGHLGNSADIAIIAFKPPSGAPTPALPLTARCTALPQYVARSSVTLISGAMYVGGVIPAGSLIVLTVGFHNTSAYAIEFGASDSRGNVYQPPILDTVALSGGNSVAIIYCYNSGAALQPGDVIVATAQAPGGSLNISGTLYSAVMYATGMKTSDPHDASMDQSLTGTGINSILCGVPAVANSLVVVAAMGGSINVDTSGTWSGLLPGGDSFVPNASSGFCLTSTNQTYTVTAGAVSCAIVTAFSPR